MTNTCFAKLTQSGIIISGPSTFRQGNSKQRSNGNAYSDTVLDYVVPFGLPLKGNQLYSRIQSGNASRFFRKSQRNHPLGTICNRFWNNPRAVPLSSVDNSSYYYPERLSSSKADPRVITALGSPIEPGLYILGSVETNCPAVRHTSRSAQRHEGGWSRASSAKELGQWSIKELVVEVNETEEQIPIILPDADSSKRSPDGAKRNPGTVNW